MNKQPLHQAELILSRLERISADSPWAHQASGIRASLAKQLAREIPDQLAIRALLERGFYILEKAASEIPDHNDLAPADRKPPGKGELPR